MKQSLLAVLTGAIGAILIIGCWSKHLSPNPAIPIGTIVVVQPSANPEPNTTETRIISDGTNYWVQTWTGYQWFTMSRVQPSLKDSLDWIDWANEYHAKIGQPKFNRPIN